MTREREGEGRKGETAEGQREGEKREEQREGGDERVSK